jgi:superoxide dismutase, Cu-Zn family
MKVGTPKRSRIVSAVLVLTVGLACAANARAGSASATVNLIDANGVGAALGTVTFKDAEKGLLIIPAFSGLPPGAHGFHIHEKGHASPASRTA